MKYYITQSGLSFINELVGQNPTKIPTPTKSKNIPRKTGSPIQTPSSSRSGFKSKWRPSTSGGKLGGGHIARTPAEKERGFNRSVRKLPLGGISLPGQSDPSRQKRTLPGHDTGAALGGAEKASSRTRPSHIAWARGPLHKTERPSSYRPDDFGDRELRTHKELSPADEVKPRVKWSSAIERGNKKDISSILTPRAKILRRTSDMHKATGGGRPQSQAGIPKQRTGQDPKAKGNQLDKK